MPELSPIPQDDGFFARIVEASASLITVHDGNNIVYASPSVEAILGYLPEEIIGQSATQIVHPEDAKVIARAAAQCREGETARVEAQVRHADGSWRWLDLAGKSLPDIAPTGVPYVVFSTRDVTDRHELVNALVEREAQLFELSRADRQYRRLVEVANEGVLWVDDQAVVTFANARMGELIGYEPTELVGRKLTDLVMVEDVGDVTQRLQFVQDHGTSRHDRRFRHRDESVIWATISTALVHDDDGTFLGTVGLVTDLTQQRAAEQARRDSELEVQRLSMLAERERLETELERALRFESLGRLAGGVAHDFNNLLGVMRNYLRVLSAQLPAGAEAFHDVGQIDAAIERAAQLTHELLVFGDRDDAVSEEFDPDELLAEVLGYATDLLGPHVSVAHERAMDTRLVRIPRAHLDRSLLNLLLNARDAMPDGGSVTVSTRTLDESGRSLVAISVRDCGVGMDPATAAAATDPFFTTKASDIGTGLGLAIVHSTVEHAGGRMQVESVPGVGTTVTLLLPTAD